MLQCAQGAPPNKADACSTGELIPCPVPVNLKDYQAFDGYQYQEAG